MTILLTDIPDTSETASVDNDAARPLASRPDTPPATRTILSMGRRGFLRTMAIGGGALAVTMLGWVGNAVPAFAVTRTSLSPVKCLGTNQPGDTPCWGATYISSLYCASDGYHRTDSHNYGSYTDYYSWRAGCGGYAGWTWTHTNGSSHRCTDGNIREIVNATGHTYYYTSICSKQL